MAENKIEHFTKIYIVNVRSFYIDFHSHKNFFNFQKLGDVKYNAKSSKEIDVWESVPVGHMLELFLAQMEFLKILN